MTLNVSGIEYFIPQILQKLIIITVETYITILNLNQYWHNKSQFISKNKNSRSLTTTHVVNNSLTCYKMTFVYFCRIKIACIIKITVALKYSLGSKISNYVLKKSGTTLAIKGIKKPFPIHICSSLKHKSNLIVRQSSRVFSLVKE